MRVDIGDIEQQLTQAASKYVTESEAAYFAKCAVETHLRKAPRMNPLQEAVADLKVWKEQMGSTIETVVDKESVLVLNFNGLAPSLKIKQIHDELERRARKNGIAALGFHNSAGVITLNMWSYGLARRDLIGISMFNGGTECCVPYGGTRGVLGTNPLAYAIPTAEQPIILDMAATEIPFFEVKQAKEQGLPLRAGVAVDRNGIPTTEAQEALTDDGVANLLPIGGGFKGYGIIMLIEILTGSLVRSLLSTQQTPGWNPTEYGCLILAIDIRGFCDLVEFKQSVSDMCGKLRSMRPADGFDGVIIPGDRGHAKVKETMQRGVCDVEDTVVEDLRQLVH
jgi:ureidoglycolate dehydrogenase (NAD+)